MKYFLRQFSSKPSFSIVVMITLALTIGSATAVFSLFDAVLLRPFPYPQSDQLVRIRTLRPAVKNSTRDFSIYDYEDIRERSHSFAHMAAYISFASNLTGQGPAQSVHLTFTTPSLFRVLGVSPVLGQAFTDDDDKLDGNVQKMLLSYGLWQEKFQGKAGIIGSLIRLRGQGYVVVGVMPSGFQYPDLTDVWVPLRARYSAVPPEYWQRRDIRNHNVLARLRDGVSVKQAASDLERINSQLASEFSETNRGLQIPIISLRQAEAGDLRPHILLVTGSVLILLLIGCFNIANLFIARSAAREREFAVRAALGAGWRQVASQLLWEGLGFGVAGAALGVGLAWLEVRTLLATIPVELPAWMLIRVDPRALLFAAVVGLLVTLVFSLAPLLQQVRPDLNDVLKQSAKGSAGVRTLASRLRQGLIIVEIALSMTSLVAAGLMLRSFAALSNARTGLNSQHLLVASVGRFIANATPQQMVDGYSNEFRRVRDRLAALPGVLSVSAGNDIPFLNQHEERPAYRIYTHQRATPDTAYYGAAAGADVMPGYFAALGVPILGWPRL